MPNITIFNQCDGEVSMEYNIFYIPEFGQFPGIQAYGPIPEGFTTTLTVSDVGDCKFSQWSDGSTARELTITMGSEDITLIAITSAKAINKVVLGTTVLMDLSEDTLTSSSQLATGVTAHGQDGKPITGNGVMVNNNQSISTLTAANGVTFTDRDGTLKNGSAILVNASQNVTQYDIPTDRAYTDPTDGTLKPGYAYAARQNFTQYITTKDGYVKAEGPLYLQQGNYILGVIDSNEKSKIIDSNIRKDISILGVTGKLVPVNASQNVQQSEVPSDKYYTNKTNGNLVQGSSTPIRTSYTQSITLKDETVQLTGPIHIESGKTITIDMDATEQSKIVGSNIKQGVTIMGESGTLQPMGKVPVQKSYSSYYGSRIPYNCNGDGILDMPTEDEFVTTGISNNKIYNGAFSNASGVSFIHPNYLDTESSALSWSSGDSIWIPDSSLPASQGHGQSTTATLKTFGLWRFNSTGTANQYVNTLFIATEYASQGAAAQRYAPTGMNQTVFKFVYAWRSELEYLITSDVSWWKTQYDNGKFLAIEDIPQYVEGTTYAPYSLVKNGSKYLDLETGYTHLDSWCYYNMGANGDTSTMTYAGAWPKVKPFTQ